MSMRSSRETAMMKYFMPSVHCPSERATLFEKTKGNSMISTRSRNSLALVSLSHILSFMEVGTFSEVRQVDSIIITGQKRAVKVVNKMHLTNTVDIKRFFYEIQLLRDLDHPGVLKIFEYFQDKDRLYIVTEYVAGGELLTEMNR